MCTARTRHMRMRVCMQVSCARHAHGGTRALEHRLTMTFMCFSSRVKLCVLAARASSLSCASVLCTSSSVSSSLRRALCSSSDCTATLNWRKRSWPATSPLFHRERGTSTRP